MSDIKKIRDYRGNRTKKIVETLAEKQRRHDDFLRKLDEAADRVLSGKVKNAPTEDELKEMRRQKPEVGEVLDALFDVADRINDLPVSPKVAPVAVPHPENDALPVSPLDAPPLGEAVENLSTLVRDKKFKSKF